MSQLIKIIKLRKKPEMNLWDAAPGHYIMIAEEIDWDNSQVYLVVEKTAKKIKMFKMSDLLQEFIPGVEPLELLSKKVAKSKLIYFVELKSIEIGFTVIA